MALQPVAILGTDGWVFTPSEKMDNLFMHFVEANSKQTTLARGSVYSFQKILNDSGKSEALLKEDMGTAFMNYFRGYYSDVQCQIAVLDNPNKPGTSILRIYLVVKDEYGKTYNLAKISSDISSKTIHWANLNNYGDENIFSQ